MTGSRRCLGDVVDFIRGITFKPEDVVSPSSTDAVVCMRTKNVQELLDETDLIAVPANLVKRSELFLREGDVLISSANSWNLVGKVVQVPALRYLATAGGFIAIVRAKKGTITPQYLYRWLAADATQAAIRSCGRQTTNISNLSVPQFLSLPIHVPPDREQHRIDAILNMASTLRRKRQEAVRLSEQFERSKFSEMFGESQTNANRFPVTTLGDVVKLKSGNFLPSHEMSGSGEVSVYGGNGINGKHDKAMFHEAKLVIGRVGAYCGAVHLTKPLSWVTDNALYVSELSPQLRLKYLAFALAQANLNQYSSQSGQPLVSASRLYPVQILLPPLRLQDDFLRALSQSSTMHLAQQASLRDFETLSRTLSDELLV